MDIFNPNHYVPRTYLDEPSLDENNINISNVGYGNPLSEKLSDVTKIVELQTNSTFKMSNLKNIIHFTSGVKGEFTTNFEIHDNAFLFLDTTPFTEQLIYHNLNFHVLSNSRLKLFLYTKETPNVKVKNNFKIQLDKNASLEINALSLIDSKQYQDESIAITHSKNSQSVINYRSFTKGFMVTQVNSIIPFDAENSSTEQNLKHTMMDDGAKIFSKPNLEISNPNVIASHGNSIGTISQEELEYLSFRGINTENANKLIVANNTETFFNNTLDIFSTLT